MKLTGKIRIIETGIDVNPFLDELERNKDLWQMVSKMRDIGGDKNPYGFLPLTMGIEDSPGNIKNSDIHMRTPAYLRFPVMRKFLVDHMASEHARAAFFKLKPGGTVGGHIDDGTYYLDKDRYHFSLQGTYQYFCDGDWLEVQPGTFFWFDNKKDHWARNISNVDRITFVFDLKHSPTNP